MRQQSLTTRVNDGASTDTKFYLLIKPIATSTVSVEHAAIQVADITGQELYTTRQKLVGLSPDVLLITTERERVEASRAKLRDAGFQAAVVSEEHLRLNPSHIRAVSVAAVTANSLAFADVNSRLICEVSKDTKPFVVIGGLNPAFYGSGREIMRHIVDSESNAMDSAEKRLSDICKNNPAAIIFSAATEQPMLIIGSQFNYRSLGGPVEYSIARNFEALIEKLESVSDACVDLDFGRKTLPLTPLASHPKSEKDSLERLRVYGRLVWLASIDGLDDQRPDKSPADPFPETPLNIVPAIGDVVSTVASGAGHHSVAESTSTSTQICTPSLPPPPAPQKRHNAFQTNFTPLLQLKNFGPPRVVGALLGIAALTAGLSAFTGAFKLTATAAPLGALLCVWALTMLLRKRAIEQLPTSRIRSAPMGAVELCGEARRKYSLTAPFSLTKCVYYSYEVMHLKIAGYNDGRPVERWVVTERGDSARVPFYLNDDTGSILVDPEGAIIDGLRSDEYSGGMFETLAGVRGDGRRRIIERVIPEGAKLYVIGHAHPRRNSAEEAREDYRRRLKELKASPELLAKYDSNRDGHISLEEFAQARADLEQKISEERLASQALSDNNLVSNAVRLVESVVVGDNPNNGLFYISDKSEPDILNGYSWRIPLVTLAGLITLAWGLINAFAK